MKKLTFTLLFALMAIVSAQAAKVYLKIGEGQVTAESNLAVWVWEGSNKFCTNKEWPGDKLIEKETIGTADYFVYTVNTEGSYNIIFNNNEKENANTHRTTEIKGLTGDCTFVLNADWNFTKTEGAPSAETPESVETYTVQLRGLAGDWNTPVALAYDSETKEYVYEETTTNNLATGFKVVINDKWLSNNEFKGALNNGLGFKNLYENNDNIEITDAADYDKITLTVKKEGETWKMKIVGEKTYTVKLAGNAYGTGWDTPVTFAYNAETKEYVYEETETAKLADYFKIDIPETKKWFKRDDLVDKNLSEASSDFVAMNDNSGDMKITDAADYDKITLTVKNDNGTWKLKIVGEKPDKVQIKGVFNSWKVADMVSNPNGTYTYEVEENMNALSEGFGFIINGAYYAGDIVLDLDSDAVDLQGNPGRGNDLTLIAEGDVASVILTVAKVGDKWTVKAATGKTSSVAGVDAAGVVIAAANGEIVVEGAQNVAVYTAAGALVSTDARTRVAAGLYIVRADNVVKKVIVK